MRFVSFATAAVIWGSGVALAADSPAPAFNFAIAAASDLDQSLPAHHPIVAGLQLNSPHARLDDPELEALRAYAKQVGVQRTPLVDDEAGNDFHHHLKDGALAVQEPDPAVVRSGEADSCPHFNAGWEDETITALRDYANEIRPESAQPAELSSFKVAEADNALDALREFWRDRSQPNPPSAAPEPDQPGKAPLRSAPAARPAPRLVPQAEPRPVRFYGDSHAVGSGTCLICHTAQANSFATTLMGRIGKTQPGKFDCENCHGPASNHLKAGGCANCHGENVSRRIGIPTLAGQKSEYLLTAMRAYVSGARRHELMRTILAGDAEADMRNAANYYSRLAPTRAQAPLPGDPAAGKAASGLCAGCHAGRDPAGPNLAGQDAQYLVSAIGAYKDNSRSKTIACAGCHGEAGISSRAGTPNLAGQNPQALLRAMKAYASGTRKHELMRIMLAGLSETELNKIAFFYAKQTPARARGPSIGGDAAAGKKRSSEDCANCHGDEGVADNPKFPNLAGQDPAYIADALNAYKNKTREFKAMENTAADLDERAIKDLAAYFSSLAPGKPELSDDEKKQAGAAEPVVVKNNIVASLDQRTANNIASYFASLTPTTAGAPVLPEPALVARAVLTGGRSLGGIISFRKNDPGRRVEENNAICLGCHQKGDRTYWSGSTHETRGVACTECHTIMQAVSRKANLKTETEPETCFQCHKDRRAQMFRSSHMPLREGKIVCSSCHNPHGTATEALLIEGSINDNCYKCHAEKRGPFLFEHTPVRENCLNCHDPHGSVNEYLLKVSRPRLCGECHTVDHGNLIAGGPRVEQAFSRSCQNCHTKVHGSNSPSGALLQR
jgi:DmsE family decaheme c-type cytochrome